MSTTVDSRVVEMSFDNKNFESNVQTSLGTLEKLKNSLNLGGSVKGLEGIDTAVKNVNMGALGDAVETVKSKFSAMEVVAITALANITNSVINVGKEMLKSLTLDPITEGFSEYELKMGSVQTIMAGTGAPLDEVMKKLNELNTYADKTIYSFADMTTNIGKFTNAGVSLDDSVKAIQGVANVAAVSGANSQEASRAMYNFAQALSAGYVKLIDWKSIENANMATVEFKTQLLESAVAAGKLEKTADGMYKVLTTNAQGSTMDDVIDATHNFNDSLSYQWMTTDVLTKTLGDYADETTDIGKKAFAAAQDVKTFTQLMDTLKEAVGSGWAETWEIVFGNFDEAKSLWTEVSNVVGGFIDSQSKARNTMLQEWKDLGGRTDLIDVFKNALTGVVSIIKPVSEAFREIFPATTGKQLADITKKIKEFTSHLKIGDGIAEKLKNTFKGVFAVIDILKEAFTAVAGGIATLVGTVVSKLLPAGNGILGVTSNIGEFLTKLDESIKQSGFFKTAVSGVVDFILQVPSKISGVFQKLTGISLGDALTKVTESISGALEKIKGFFSEFKNIDTSSIDSLTDKVKIRFEPLTALCNGFKSLFSGLWNFLKKLSPIFLGLATAIGNALGKLGETISDKLGNADFNGILDLINGGILVAIGVGIKKFIDNLSGITEGVGGALDSITGILDGVKGCFEAWQKDIQAKTLIKIAVAIGIITASLVALSLVDSQKLTVALAAMSAEMIELFTMFKAVGKIDATGTAKAAGTMILMSTAILLLTSACKKLSELDWEGLLKGIVSVAALSETLVLVAKQLSNSEKGLIKGTSGLILFAVAIRMLVDPVKELGSLNIGELAKGLISVGVLCAELAAFLKIADLDNISLGKGLGIMALAGAVTILASAVSKFAGMDTAGMIKGLVGVAAVLAEVAIFTKLTGNVKNVTLTAVGMTVLGAAMLIFGEAIEKIGSLSLTTIAKGLSGMAVALTELVVAMKFMPADILSKSAGFLVAAAALVVLSDAFSSFGGMSWEGIAKGLVAMGLALAELAIGLNVMNGTLAGSAALLVASAAIAVLTPALKGLGNMSWGEIAKGLIAMAGAFTVIGVAGLVLGPITPVILALSAAVALLGVGCLACGAGLLAFSAGITALAAAGTAGITALIFAIEVIIGLIPGIAVAVGKGIINIVKIIGESATTICKTVTEVGKAVLQALTQLIPEIVNFIKVLLRTIADAAPDLCQSAIDIIIAVICAVRDNIGKIVEVVADVIIQIINAIGDAVPRIVQAGLDLIWNLIEGLGQGIEDNAQKLHDAFISLFKHILKAICNLLGIHSPSTVMAEVGMNMILGLIDGIGDKLDAFVNKLKDLITAGLTFIKNKLVEWFNKGKELIENVISGVASKIEAFKQKVTSMINDGKQMIINKFTEWLNAGQDLINKVINGVSNKIEAFKTKVTGLVDSGKTAISNKVSEWADIGKNLVEGMIKGIGDKAQALVDKAKGVVDNAISAAKNLLGIKSPSRVFKRIGQYVDEGFIIGLESYSDKVSNATEGVAKTTIDTMTNTIAKLSKAIEDGVDDPVIKPVLDLTNFEEGINDMQDSLGSTARLNVGSVYRRAVGAIQNGGSTASSSGNNSTGDTTYTFTQNNYSPKALSRIEIYRQTKNQFSAMERAVAEI